MLSLAVSQWKWSSDEEAENESEMMQPTIIYDDSIDCDYSDDYTNNQ